MAFLATVAVLPVPHNVSAHTLQAPDTLTADAHGQFSFQAIFIAGPATLLSSYGQISQNVGPGDWVADCFCNPGFCTIQDGETLGIAVQG